MGVACFLGFRITGCHRHCCRLFFVPNAVRGHCGRDGFMECLGYVVHVVNIEATHVHSTIAGQVDVVLLPQVIGLFTCQERKDN